MNNFEQNVSEMKAFMVKYETFKLVIEDLYLIAITDSYKRLIHIPEINLLTENKIRNKIQYDFEHNSEIITEYIDNETITFNSESQIITEENVFRTDIKLYCRWYGRSFVFECKKFNPYNNDYIKGHYDKEKEKDVYNGIERFTERIYAKKDKFAGMIGFVCSGEITQTIENLKTKVRTFCFVSDSEYLLNSKCVDWEFSFQSKHIRIDGSTIHLYHLFFDFSKNKAYTINGRHIIFVEN